MPHSLLSKKIVLSYIVRLIKTSESPSCAKKADSSLKQVDVPNPHAESLRDILNHLRV